MTLCKIAARPSRTGGSDDGFALVMVLVIMALLTAFVITSIAYATHNIGPARRAQDAQAAIAAAQSAIDDYTSRLNNCGVSCRFRGFMMGVSGVRGIGHRG